MLALLCGWADPGVPACDKGRFVGQVLLIVRKISKKYELCMRAVRWRMTILGGDVTLHCSNHTVLAMAEMGPHDTDFRPADAFVASAAANVAAVSEAVGVCGPLFVCIDSHRVLAFRVYCVPRG